MQVPSGNMAPSHSYMTAYEDAVTVAEQAVAKHELEPSQRLPSNSWSSSGLGSSLQTAPRYSSTSFPGGLCNRTERSKPVTAPISGHLPSTSRPSSGLSPLQRVAPPPTSMSLPVIPRNRMEISKTSTTTARPPAYQLVSSTSRPFSSQNSWQRIVAPAIHPSFPVVPRNGTVPSERVTTTARPVYQQLPSNSQTLSGPSLSSSIPTASHLPSLQQRLPTASVLRPSQQPLSPATPTSVPPPSLTVNERARAGTERASERLRKSAMLDTFMQNTRGKCGRCFVTKSELLAHEAFHDCADDGVNISADWYASVKSLFSFKGYTYCYNCAVPQDRRGNGESPDCHRHWAFKKGSICPWADFIYIAIWSLWNHPFYRAKFLQDFGLPDLNYDGFAQWVVQDDPLSDRYHNGLEMYLWYCQIWLDTGLR
jgi:hypothetical protein